MNFHSQRKEKKGMCHIHIVAFPISLPHTQLEGMGGRLVLLLKHVMLIIINPRCACAARVTVIVLSVCLSVCPDEISDYRLRGGLWAIPTASVPQGLENLMWRFY